jgi:hypothetical protein
MARRMTGTAAAKQIHVIAAKLRDEAALQHDHHATLKFRQLAWRLLNIADEADKLGRDPVVQA